MSRRDGTFFGDPGMRGNGPPNIEGMITLKVDNVPYNSSIDDLRRIFEKYGELGDVYMPRDLRTGEPRGFAFVRFMDQRDADDAIDRMDGEFFAGRELRIQYAKKRRPETSGGYGGGGGGGGYGGGSGGGRYDRRDDRRDDYRRSSRRSPSRSRSRDRTRRRDSRSSSPPRRERSRDRRRSKSKSPPPRRRSRSRSRSPVSKRSKHRDGSAEGGSDSRKGRDRRGSSADGQTDKRNGYRDSNPPMNGASGGRGRRDSDASASPH